MIILQAENITAGYTTEVNILSEVGIRLESGQIVSVIGPNGAGKSTLLKTIFGILKPANGKIRLKNEDITGIIAGGAMSVSPFLVFFSRRKPVSRKRPDVY